MSSLSVHPAHRDLAFILSEHRLELGKIERLVLVFAFVAQIGGFDSLSFVNVLDLFAHWEHLRG